MGRLHRRNHAQLRKARNILRAQDLRVFDAEAMIARGHGRERGLVGVEHDAVAAIADRVHRCLEAGAQRAGGDVLDVGLRGAQQSGVAGIVAVGFQQCGAARAERAVDIEFDRANLQASIVRADDRSVREMRGDEIGIVGDHHVVAQRKFVFVGDSIVGLGGLAGNARVGDRGDAPAVTFADGGDGGTADLVVGGGRDGLGYEGPCVIDEDAGGVAAGVADDAAAGGVGGVLRYLCELHRFRVGEECVVVDASQDDRAVRERLR